MTPADVGLLVLDGLGGGLALLQLQLVEPRTQHLPGLVAVLVLGAARLAGDSDPGRDVGQTHGGVGLVDVLTAGA